MESLISLLILILVVACVAGLICYCISILPIDARIKQIATAVVIICMVLWLLVHLAGNLGAGDDLDIDADAAVHGSAYAYS